MFLDATSLNKLCLNELAVYFYIMDYQNIPSTNIKLFIQTSYICVYVDLYSYPSLGNGEISQCVEGIL